MKVLICDDQKEFLIKLKKLLVDILSEIELRYHLISFTNPDQALEYITVYMDVDIVFMDILMGEKNGYEIAKKIRKISPKCKIIFLTTTTAYALKGYLIQVACYLTKPVKRSELANALGTVIKELQSQYNNNEYIIEKNDFGIHKLYFNEIIFIETSKRNTLIHTISGNYVSYKSMKEHEKRLNNLFIRCHSSYIVNMNFIKDYHGYELYLISGDIVWVSKNRRKEFLYTLTKFYGNLLR
ncbi:MAG: response regulator transcription factor [Lachnospiraceae bacterium]|nr:response regulator transcription factor [Lachnospiraceae bacterium]